MTKFFAVVIACGIYQNANRICIEWTDQRWHASRELCMKRAQSIVSDLKTLSRYARLKLEKSPVPTCKMKED